MATLEDFLALTRHAQQGNDGWYLISCIHPSHFDDEPSLGIKEFIGKDGKPNVLLNCFAGCDKNEIFAVANGKKLKQINLPKHVLEKLARGESYKTSEIKTPEYKLVKEYEYTDEKGNVKFKKLRYESTNLKEKKKTFAFRSARTEHQSKFFGQGTKWSPGLQDNEHCLYKLDVLNAFRDKQVPVIIDESEKNVDWLIEQGFVATCSSNKDVWREDWVEFFYNKDIIIIPHNDSAGIKFPEKIFTQYVTSCNSFKIVHLPVDKPKEDVLDWIENYEGCVEKLWEYIDNAVNFRHKSFDELRYYLHNRKLKAGELNSPQQVSKSVLHESLEQMHLYSDIEYENSYCVICKNTGYIGTEKNGMFFIVANFHDDNEAPELQICNHVTQLNSQLTQQMVSEDSVDDMSEELINF